MSFQAHKDLSGTKIALYKITKIEKNIFNLKEWCRAKTKLKRSLC